MFSAGLALPCARILCVLVLGLNRVCLKKLKFCKNHKNWFWGWATEFGLFEIIILFSILGFVSATSALKLYFLREMEPLFDTIKYPSLIECKWASQHTFA